MTRVNDVLLTLVNLAEHSVVEAEAIFILETAVQDDANFAAIRVLGSLNEMLLGALLLLPGFRVEYGAPRVERDEVEDPRNVVIHVLQAKPCSRKDVVQLCAA